MSHRKATAAIRSTAALYALGALAAAEAREFEQHLEGGCDICLRELKSFNEMSAELALAVPAVAPPPALRDRILEATRPHMPSGMSILRHNAGAWRTLPVPGVSCKVLHFNPATGMATSLLRMQPGVSFPAHHHGAEEQCLVLEGDIRSENTVMGPGDYSINVAGSDHKKLFTVNGCLLLLVSSLEDERLA